MTLLKRSFARICSGCRHCQLIQHWSSSKQVVWEPLMSKELVWSLWSTRANQIPQSNIITTAWEPDGVFCCLSLSLLTKANWTHIRTTCARVRQARVQLDSTQSDVRCIRIDTCCGDLRSETARLPDTETTVSLCVLVQCKHMCHDSTQIAAARHLTGREHLTQLTWLSCRLMWDVRTSTGTICSFIMLWVCPSVSVCVCVVKHTRLAAGFAHNRLRAV